MNISYKILTKSQIKSQIQIKIPNQIKLNSNPKKEKGREARATIWNPSPKVLNGLEKFLQNIVASFQVIMRLIEWHWASVGTPRDEGRARLNPRIVVKEARGGVEHDLAHHGDCVAMPRCVWLWHCEACSGRCRPHWHVASKSLCVLITPSWCQFHGNIGSHQCHIGVFGFWVGALCFCMLWFKEHEKMN